MSDEPNSSIVTTVGLFLASAAWFTSWRRRRRHNHISLIMPNPGHYDDDDESYNNNERQDEVLGPRGLSALKPTVPYWHSFFLCLQNPCDPLSNPEGHIALCVAENKLVQEAFATRLMRSGTSYTAFSNSVVYSYNGFLGLPAARAAAAYFIARRFLRAKDGGKASMPSYHYSSSSSQMMNVGKEGATSSSSHRVNPEHIALGSGCASLLNNLFFALARRGDAVLIPAPYHSAFEYDMQAVPGCVPCPVQMKNPLLGPTLKELLMTAYKAEKQGLRVKILLLNNPNDPLGVIYKPNVIRDAVTWARNRSMHVIVDEIYALSVHKRDNHNFQSVVRILNNDLGNDVHMLWGLSKDFGASGFRVGILYTQNDLLLRSLANLNIFSGVSQPMQLIVAEILTDDEFVDAFLEDARAQLTWSYTICARKLEEMVITYVPAEAGLCVYVDFSSLLPSQTVEGEEKFATLVQDYARVVMTPGQCLRDRKPGMFRICYAWVTPDILEVAMERLSYLVTKIRRYQWDDLDDVTLNDVVKCGARRIRRNASINLAELTGVDRVET